MEIVEAAAKLRPGTAWNYDGKNLTQAADDTPRVAIPTMAEVMALVNSEAYMEKRAREYPSLTDQLDALWKGGTAADDMKAKVMAVKAKYPKPV